MQERRLIRSKTESLKRLADAKVMVAQGVDPSNVQRHMQNLTKPKSPASTMKKVGVALIAAPDPITAVPGVALVVGSYVMKKKEPATLDDLAAETKKILRDIESFSI